MISLLLLGLNTFKLLILKIYSMIPPCGLKTQHIVVFGFLLEAGEDNFPFVFCFSNYCKFVFMQVKARE